jgi:hypothetical protein
MPGTAFNAANWGGYAEAQVQSDYRPASTVTGFSFIIDLSDLPASFGSAVQSDGADIRVTDGTNELPYDLIDWNYNSGSPTGLLRVKADSATTGTTVRVYADYTLGTAVAYDANDISGFGSDNAYDADWEGYWPDGGGVDRTSNGRDTTAFGGVVAGDTAGKIGSATSFDGVDDYFTFSQYATSGDFSILLWAQRTGVGTAPNADAATFIGNASNAGFTQNFAGSNNASVAVRLRRFNTVALGTVDLTNQAHLAVTRNGSNQATLYENSTGKTPVSATEQYLFDEISSIRTYYGIRIIRFSGIAQHVAPTGSSTNTTRPTIMQRFGERGAGRQTAADPPT